MQSHFLRVSLLFSCLFAIVVSLTFMLQQPASAAEESALARQASWQMVSPATARANTWDYLEKQQASQEILDASQKIWPEEGAELTGQEVLDKVIETLSLTEPRLQEIRDWAANPQISGSLPPFALLEDATVAEFVSHNVRLFLARACVQRDLADECLALLNELTPTQVVDPAGLLFHRAIAHHRLLQKDECLKNAKLLLEREADLPTRYVRLSHLMADDIGPLKTDSLDEISRMMEDVRRRLDHGRAGTKVRDEEDEIVAKLDKMIEKLEEEQKKQQQQQQSGQPNGQNPNNPAQDSTPGELKGPGEVDIRDIGKKSGWGNLPPKERQEVLQQIGKELPAHFRETIEEYFQRLAQDGVK